MLYTRLDLHKIFYFHVTIMNETGEIVGLMKLSNNGEIFMSSTGVISEVVI